MNIKESLKKFLISISTTKKGVVLLNYLRGIVSIMENEACRRYRNEINTRLAIGNLVGNNKEIIDMQQFIYDESAKKIKIRFFHCSDSTFNVIQTVCEYFRSSPNYDVLIVLFGNLYSGMIKQMKELNFPYIADYNYDLRKDSPDISVIYHLEMYYPPQLTEIRKYSKYVSLVPLGLGSIWFGDRTLKRMNLSSFNADLCFVGNLCFNRLKDSIGKDKAVRCTPAQFDLSYRKFSEPKTYPPGWEKLKGKKTLMLMTDHGIQYNKISDEVSFDLYFKNLIEFFNKNKEVGLILRLHFALIHELVSTFWSLDDYKSFVKYCNESPNIVWDETSDYLTGLHIADGVMIDVNCSLIYFALAANKPIAIPYRYDMDVEVNNPDLLQYYYSIRSNEDMVSFIDTIIKGEDPMKTQRQKAFDMFIETFDGKNGERIGKIIDERYRSRVL